MPILYATIQRGLTAALLVMLAMPQIMVFVVMSMNVLQTLIVVMLMPHVRIQLEITHVLVTLASLVMVLIVLIMMNVLTTLMTATPMELVRIPTEHLHVSVMLVIPVTELNAQM